MRDSIRRLATAVNNYVRYQARDEEYTECMRCGRIQFNTELGCLQCERDARAGLESDRKPPTRDPKNLEPGTIRRRPTP